MTTERRKEREKKKKQRLNTNIFDYLNWRGDIPFSARPLCEVDNLVFSMIAYMDYTGVVPAMPIKGKKPDVLWEVTQRYLKARSGIHENIGLVIPKEIIKLFVLASKTQRFGTVRPFCYEQKFCDEEQMQFSAISFYIPGGDVFVAFRGTDDTLVGWKENFNMMFMHPVPAQKEAARYLEKIASMTKGRIFVGGHSKGGNLAIYSAAKANDQVKERIAAVYSNDGPGFDKRFVKGKDFLSIKDKLHKFIPQSSVVGLLLEHVDDATVVKSTSGGLLQHNGLTWAIMGEKFVHLEELNANSKRMESKLKDWMAGLSPSRRAKFVDALYDALSSTSARTLTDLASDRFNLIRVWSSLDDETKMQLRRALVLVLLRKNGRYKVSTK